MMKVTIQMPDDPAKVEEIEALKKFAKALPRNTYLKMLFTDDFVTWVENRIRDDFPCNLYGEYLAESTRHMQTASIVKTQENQIDEFREDAKKHAADRRTMVALEETVAALQEERAVFEKNIVDAAEHQKQMEATIAKQAEQKAAMESQDFGLKRTLIKIANNDENAEEIKATVRLMTAPVVS